MATAAFDAFYRENYAAVLRFVVRRIADEETAKEVAAECFVTAWRKFDPADPFPVTWLYRTARNHLGNAYQKRAREQRLLETVRLNPPAPTDDPEALAVTEALSTLGDADREALRLTYWEQLSARDVAEVLGVSEQAAWKRISRARTALRAALVRIQDAEGV